MTGFGLLLIAGMSTFGLTVGPGLLASSAVTLAGMAKCRETASTPPAAGTSSMPPEEVAGSFCKWYLHALYQSPNADPFRANKAVVEQYVTARLLQELANSRRTSTAEKGPDADTVYFFGTLDLSSEWEKYIAVSTPAMKGPAAVVHITLSGTAENRGRLAVELERKVVLVQEAGLWKIDQAGVWPQ